MEQLIISQAQDGASIAHFMYAIQPVCHVVTSADLRWYDPSTRLLRLAVCYASACSLPVLESQNLFSITKDSLVKTLKTYTELSLSKADIFDRPSLSTLQAVVVSDAPACQRSIPISFDGHRSSPSRSSDCRIG